MEIFFGDILYFVCAMPMVDITFNFRPFAFHFYYKFCENLLSLDNDRIIITCHSTYQKHDTNVSKLLKIILYVMDIIVSCFFFVLFYMFGFFFE